MTMLLSKLVKFVDYSLTEQIFDNLTTPEPANVLLHRINNTLPMIIERYVSSAPVITAD